MLNIRKDLQELKPCSHGGKAQEIAESSGCSENDYLDFSVNLNPYPPKDAQDVIKKAYCEVSKYPDNRYNEFKRSAAKFAGVKPENIVPGNGSTEIIRLFAEAIIEKGDIIAIPCPTFGEYEQQCRLFGARVRYLKFEDLLKKEYWQLDGCNAAFLCNPNNPDGRLITAGEVLEIAAHCKEKGISLVVDEAFIDLADPKESVAKYVNEYDNMFVMRSLTKCFSIPGFRLGFGIADRRSAELLNIIRLTWNLNNITSEVGIYYMDNSRAYLDISRAYIKREREWLAENLCTIKCISVIPSTVNYFLVDVSGTGMTSTEFAARMLNEKVIVRDCNSFKMLGDSHVRLAVRTREENKGLVEAIRKVISEARN